ncbi:reverse transcriptase domain-containing protein [Tanacetum coccineum]
MCDASDFAVGAVLGQREGKHVRPIHFASKTLNNAQQNYMVTEKKLLAVVFAFDKFCSYLVLLKTIDLHTTMHQNKKGAENVMADHLSRLENSNLEELRDEDIDDNFPDETLMNVSSNDEDGTQKRFNLRSAMRCVYGSETRKILDECHHGPTGGHYGPSTIAKKVFDAGFYWLKFFKEAHTLIQNCDACQHSGSLSRRDEMPQNIIQVSEYTLI